MYPGMPARDYIHSNRVIFDICDANHDGALIWTEYKNYVEKILMQFRDSREAPINH